MKNKLGELTDKLFDWKGLPAKDRVLLYDAGRLVIDGFESRYAAVRKTLSALTADVAATQVTAPHIPVSRLGADITGSLDSNAQGRTMKILNYYAAPGSSLSSEEDLFASAGRARMVGW